MTHYNSNLGYAETLGSILRRSMEQNPTLNPKETKMKLHRGVVKFIARAIINISPDLLRVDLIDLDTLKTAIDNSPMLVQAIQTKDKVACIRELKKIVSCFEGATYLVIPDSFCSSSPHIKKAKEDYGQYELGWYKANLPLREAKDIADILFWHENINNLLVDAS